MLEGGLRLLEEESGQPVSEYEQAVFQAHPEMLDRILARVLEAKG